MLTQVDHIDMRVNDLEATVETLKKMGLQEKRRTPAPRSSGSAERAGYRLQNRACHNQGYRAHCKQFPRSQRDHVAADGLTGGVV